MFLFKRAKRDDEPVDLEARSPQTGLKYKDIALLGQLMQNGADLSAPRHALYYLYFEQQADAERGAEQARAAGYTCDVHPAPGPAEGQWSLVCERPDAVLDIDGVRTADDLFQGIADGLRGDFDGWEAAV
jgi:Regulator of ribonuclease activity B